MGFPRPRARTVSALGGFDEEEPINSSSGAMETSACRKFDGEFAKIHAVAAAESTTSAETVSSFKIRSA
eukprot:symbB.v1.2.034843.t1/scaffold4572.1/size43354/2